MCCAQLENNRLLCDIHDVAAGRVTEYPEHNESAPYVSLLLTAAHFPPNHSPSLPQRRLEGEKCGNVIDSEVSRPFVENDSVLVCGRPPSRRRVPEGGGPELPRRLRSSRRWRTSWAFLTLALAWPSIHYCALAGATFHTSDS